jgi:ketosteroid isomerase-like protein
MPEPDRPDTAATRSEPGRPEPGSPEPIRPEPGSPEPGSPEPGKPEPGKPEPGSPADVFYRLVHGVGDRNLDELPGLYAEHTHVVHPQDPRRSPVLTTRQALDEHFRRGIAMLGEIRFQPAAITVHQTADPEVVIGEFEYRGVAPGTGEPFAISNIFVLRVRDGQIVESRDYADHLAIARLLGTQGQLAGGAEDWLDRAQRHYEDAFFNDDTGALDTAERELGAVEAGLALACGRIQHARFLAGGEPSEATLRQFEHAAARYAELGDPRGEAEALFWVATFHQAVHGDHQTAWPLLERAEKLATAAGDDLTLSYVTRHIGFAEEDAGRLDLARQRYTESVRLRREVGFERGVAAALLALAEFASRHGEPAEALELLAEADAVAQASDAGGITRRIEQARAQSR